VLSPLAQTLELTQHTRHLCTAFTTYANALRDVSTVPSAIEDLVHYVQYPHRPLLDQDDTEPTPAFKRALKRTFRALDDTGSFLLGTRQLSALRRYVYGIQDQKGQSAGFIAFVQSKFPDGVAEIPGTLTASEVKDGVVTTHTTRGAPGTDGLGLTFDGWQLVNLTQLHDNWEEMVWCMLHCMHAQYTPPDPPTQATAAVMRSVASVATLSTGAKSLLQSLLQQRGVRGGLRLALPDSYASWYTPRADQCMALSKAGRMFLEHLFHHYARSWLNRSTGEVVDADEDCDPPPGWLTVLLPSGMDKLFATAAAPVGPEDAKGGASGKAYLAGSPLLMKPALDRGEARWVSATENTLDSCTPSLVLTSGSPEDACVGGHTQQAVLLTGEPNVAPLDKDTYGWWGHPFGPTFPWNVTHETLPAATAVRDVSAAAQVSQAYGTGFAARAGAAARLVRHAVQSSQDALQAMADTAGAQGITLQACGFPAPADSGEAAAAGGPMDPAQLALPADASPALKTAAEKWAHWVEVSAVLTQWAHAEAAAVPTRPWVLTLSQWLAVWHLLACTQPSRALRAIAQLGFLTVGDAQLASARASSSEAALYAALAEMDAPAVAPSPTAWLGDPASLLQGGGKHALPQSSTENTGIILPERVAADVQATSECNTLSGAGQSPHLALAVTPARKAAPHVPSPVRQVFVLGSAGVGKTTFLQASLATRGQRHMPWATAVSGGATGGADTPCTGFVDVATAAAARRADVPQSVVLAAPAADYERERASCKQLGEDWAERCLQLRALPSYLVAVEWPASMAVAALQKAEAEADCVVFLVDPADAESVAFLESGLDSVSDHTPVVVVQAHRQGTPVASIQQHQARVVELCDALDVDANFTFNQGTTSSASLRSGLWKVVSNFSCDPESCNPQTEKRVSKAQQVVWRKNVSKAAKLAVLSTALIAAGTGAWVYRQEINSTVKVGIQWAKDMFARKEAAAKPESQA